MPRQPLTREQHRLRQAEFVADLEKTPEFNILNSLVTPPGNGAKDAVQEIVDITKASQGDKDSNHVYDTACSVLEVASRTVPEKQDELVDFVNELQKRTVKDRNTGEPRKYSGEDLLWTELPTFGFTFGDELQSKDPLDPENTSRERQHLENLNAFIAKLTESSATIHTDFSFWALTAFKLAFGPWDKSPSSTHYAVRVVCLWYIYSADKLWAKIKDEEQTNWKTEDWDRYKQGLIESQARWRNQATKKLIEEALKELRRAEGR